MHTLPRAGIIGGSDNLVILCEQSDIMYWVNEASVGKALWHVERRKVFQSPRIGYFWLSCAPKGCELHKHSVLLPYLLGMWRLLVLFRISFTHSDKIHPGFETFCKTFLLRADFVKENRMSWLVSKRFILHSLFEEQESLSLKCTVRSCGVSEKSSQGFNGALSGSPSSAELKASATPVLQWLVSECFRFPNWRRWFSLRVQRLGFCSVDFKWLEHCPWSKWQEWLLTSAALLRVV